MIDLILPNDDSPIMTTIISLTLSNFPLLPLMNIIISPKWNVYNNIIVIIIMFVTNINILIKKMIYDKHYVL